MALACGGSKSTTTAKADDTTEVQKAVAHADAAACAKKAELVGGNCSYSTGMMAQRVVAEGSPWTFAGSLAKADGELSSHVAAPYSVGPDGVRVVANEVLDNVADASMLDNRLNLEGKVLEVDGVKYFVLTGYSALNS